MTRIVVVDFVTLDGVVQSPLSVEEDRDGGFGAGGWVQPAMDEVVAGVLGAVTTAAGGFVFGRRTYETFARTWSVADRSEPAVEALNSRPKHVASRTLTTVDWANSHLLGPDVVGELRVLKEPAGGDLVVFGSSGLVPTLLAAELVDAFTLLVFPRVLGTGKKLFPDGVVPLSLALTSSEVSSSGVVVLRYAVGDRAGG